MLSRVKIVAISVVIAVIATGLTVMAGSPGQSCGASGQSCGVSMHGSIGAMGNDCMGSPMQCLSALDLTDVQKEAIRALMEEKHADIGETGMTAMRDAQRKLMALIHDPAATEAQIRGAHAAVSELHGDKAVAMHEMAVAILGMLTDEQKQKLEQLKKACMGEPEGAVGTGCQGHPGCQGHQGCIGHGE
jgi:Spy/CpxP family protein refolding chaperone